MHWLEISAVVPLSKSIDRILKTEQLSLFISRITPKVIYSGHQMVRRAQLSRGQTPEIQYKPKPYIIVLQRRNYF